MKLPYYSLSRYFKDRYGVRVGKITVSLPFTCPHDGCSYCYDGGIPPLNSTKIPLKSQIEAGIFRVKKKYGQDSKFMIYYQAYTNTNAPLYQLKEAYDEALNYRSVVGISIGTRPDCAGEKVLDLLDSYADNGMEVWMEYGLQSANSETLRRINRGHTVAEWEDAVKRTKKRRIKTAAHVIIGMPWENHDDFMNTAKLAAGSGIDGIKIHPLYVMDKTKLGEEYKKNKFKLLNPEEYVKILADIIEILPEEMVIMRFTAEGDREKLLAPGYCSPEYKQRIRQSLIEELSRRGTKQGSGQGV